MKKYTLPNILLALLFACNQPGPTPAVQLPVSTDSNLKKQPDQIVADSAIIGMAEYNLGNGLTQEEMTDDTVFLDGSKPTSWEVTGISDVKGFKLFLKRIQLLVLKDDKGQLAKYIRYPLRKSIKSEKDFIKNYPAIFTMDVKLSIAKINFSQIFRNFKGVMSEDGKVWFMQQGKDFKITAVNS
ncbi:MAG: hypothetical protein ABIN94_11120 [Ferruginibacter sp.]